MSNCCALCTVYLNSSPNKQTSTFSNPIAKAENLHISHVQRPKSNFYNEAKRDKAFFSRLLSFWNSVYLVLCSFVSFDLSYSSPYTRQLIVVVGTQFRNFKFTATPTAKTYEFNLLLNTFFFLNIHFTQRHNTRKTHDTRHTNVIHFKQNNRIEN